MAELKKVLESSSESENTNLVEDNEKIGNIALELNEKIEKANDKIKEVFLTFGWSEFVTRTFDLGRN